MNAALLLHERGCKVVAISDVAGGLHNPDGLDVADIRRYKDREGGDGTIAGYEGPGVERVAHEDFMGVDCDVLVPAAIESAVNDENVDSVRARIVVEGANLPLTPEADRKLSEGGVLVVPDILANAGGVTVSYFEWSQNFQQYTWDEKDVNARLEQVMLRAYRDVVGKAKALGCTLREAAFALAIDRIVRVEKLRGSL
jgi:glutamate dehydrogenase (NAD(P)+)